MRRGATAKIVLASGNLGKLRELGELLADLDVSLCNQQELGVSEVAETGLTFVENAILKARNAARHSGLPAIADDSGLEVDALQGAPGIYSARYAGPDADDARNVARLLEELDGLPAASRIARFQCLVVFLRHADDPTPIICQGTWEGRILSAPIGRNGFGYDPVFFVPGHQCSAAQLDTATKNSLSHRGQALAHLRERLGHYLAQY